MSNAERPLFDAAVDRRAYGRTAWAFLGLAIFFAQLVAFQATFVILLFAGNYFLY